MINPITEGIDPEISGRIHLQVMQLTNLVKVPPFNDPDFFGPVLQASHELMNRLARVRREKALLAHAKSPEQRKDVVQTIGARVRDCLDWVAKFLVPCAGVQWKAVERYDDAGRALIKELARPEVLGSLPHDRLRMLTDFIESERVRWIQPFIDGKLPADEAEVPLFDFCRDFAAFALYLKAPVFMLLREQTIDEAIKTWSIPESRFVKWRLEQK